MNEEQTKKINKIKENQLSLQDSFRACFESADGKKVLRYLQRKFYFHKTTQVFGMPGKTEYNNGQRDVVLAIVDFIHKDKEQIIKAIEENYQHDNSSIRY